MQITARNYAAALSYLGADVESALLELVTVAPKLDKRVRAALFAHEVKPKLRFMSSRHFEGLLFVHYPMSKHVCAMHAVDLLTLVIDDGDCVAYLRAKFPNVDIEVLREHA